MSWGVAVIERLTRTAARNIFYGGSLFFLVIFGALTAASHIYIVRHSTDEKTLTASVSHGKRVWERHACINCHTLLGEGGRSARLVPSTHLTLYPLYSIVSSDFPSKWDSEWELLRAESQKSPTFSNFCAIIGFPTQNDRLADGRPSSFTSAKSCASIKALPCSRYLLLDFGRTPRT